MDFLEYRSLKAQHLVQLNGLTATINRGEITVIDVHALDAEIAKRKTELEQLQELRADLPLVYHVP